MTQSLYPQAELWEPLVLLGHHVSTARVLEGLRAFPGKLIPGILSFMGLLPTLTPTLHSDPTLFLCSSVFLFQMELHDLRGPTGFTSLPSFSWVLLELRQRAISCRHGYRSFLVSQWRNGYQGFISSRD